MAALNTALLVPQSARGWNRPARPVALVLVGGAVLLIWLALMIGGVWYFYEHWEARLTMLDHGVRLRLPPGMQAMAEVTSPVHSRLNLRPEVTVPVKQTIPAQLSDHIQARVKLHTSLPVDTSVVVDQQVQVKTTLSLSVALRSWLPRIPVSLPVTLTLPLRMDVPIKADVPVDLDLVVSGELPHTLNIPIDARFSLRPVIDTDIETRMVSQTAFELISPMSPFDLTIARADLKVPFDLTVLRQRHR
ncbi:MAG: hypothetical protein EKK47_12735 [Burkholderiales bacterium]|jgi:hypothetical protein|nr:MAG: hypothetical protein EKK47_12735 [Burkholderiales bacterium]